MLHGSVQPIFVFELGDGLKSHELKRELMLNTFGIGVRERDFRFHRVFYVGGCAHDGVVAGFGVFQPVLQSMVVDFVCDVIGVVGCLNIQRNDFFDVVGSMAGHANAFGYWEIVY